MLYHNLYNAKKREISKHPWETTIKDKFLCNIKSAHNSVYNPPCIAELNKKIIQSTASTKFTVIGNRVTKEFIYCSNLVTGLCKYRKNEFVTPIIRGVNGVEWPFVLKDIQLKYGGLAYCLPGQVAVLINDQFLGGENELKELIDAKYSYKIYPDYYQEAVGEFTKYVNSSCRPCVYMHISINGAEDGTMIFMLYSDIVPRTCENFMRLCKEKRGGYSGTPVHRIVKDGWIQCGGFGLKSTKLDCENFIVPHDRRGLLCMANEGRHIDCSTQFFVLLQPAPWMENKYVAFGQLIDGAKTLRKIENVPTWYEAPTVNVTIYEAGILNLESQDIVVNKGINEYIQSHVENLNELRGVIVDWITEKLFSEINMRELAESEYEEGEQASDEDRTNVRATKRFIRNKEEIEKQLETNENGDGPLLQSDDLNEDFDVEYYESEFQYESEAEPSNQKPPSLKTEQIVDIPFYLPLTDAPYPGEIDSTHDLKKFLKGHYCLEGDLIEVVPNAVAKEQKMSYTSEIFNINDVYDSDNISILSSLDSEDEREIRRYIKLNVDRVSFAGGIVRGIARGVGKYNIFEDARKSELITEDDFRKFRSTSIDSRGKAKKVSLIVPESEKQPEKIKRRATGFPLPATVERIIRKKSSFSVEEEESLVTGDAPTDSRKVRIATALPSKAERPTVDRTQSSDTEVHRRSVLSRLIDDVAHDDEPGPILKDYRPISESKQRNILLTRNTLTYFDEKAENSRDKYLRPYIKMESSSIDRVMNIQHNKKLVRKISSDYAKTLGQIDQPLENSIRSIEFAKKRPSMSIAQYQRMNQMQRESLKETPKE